MQNQPNAMKRMKVSEEGDKKGLELARAEGEALSRTVAHMVRDVAEGGAELAAGDYLIACAVEKAEGLYRFRDGELEWQEPERENVHIEVSVRDASDGRFVPYLPVRIAVQTADGKDAGSGELPFLWHPYLYHYGADWKVPGDGEYTIQVRVGVPQFARHDKVNGRRYAQPAEAIFRGIRIKTGKE